jgi:hypothetical protein
VSGSQGTNDGIQEHHVDKCKTMKNKKIKTSHNTNFKTGSETWYLINDWVSPWMVGSNTKASTVQQF